MDQQVIDNHSCCYFQVWKQIENCEQFQGFIINHSVAGGTGSGLTSLIIIGELKSVKQETEKQKQRQASK